jgi:hypothetical protein
LQSRIILFFLWFIIAIPFIPQLFVGTDNQPTFTIFGCIFLFFTSASLSKKISLITFILFISFLIATFYINLIFGINFQVSRVLAFFQFLIALQLGSSKYFYLPENWFYYFIRIYAVFTIIYFLTGGIVEDTFILSRLSGAEDLMSSGRGARTLSPEPAIMTIQLFNILVLHQLFYKYKKITFSTLLLLLISLIGSLSGYGFAISLVLIFVFSPYLFISILGVSALFFSLVSSNFDVGNSRILIILSSLKENGFDFFFEDASFATRLNSFNDYYTSFIQTFPFGDAFSLMNGGGFISIISALGFLGFLFFLIYFVTIFISNLNFKLKTLLISWSMIHFLSGSFGVPLVGIIIGKFLKDHLKYE